MSATTGPKHPPPATNLLHIVPNPLDLRLHHVADVEERAFSLTDAAASAADEDVAGLQSKKMSEAYSICSSGVKMNFEV